MKMIPTNHHVRRSADLISNASNAAPLIQHPPRRSRRSGSILVIVVAAIVAFIGFLGFAIDCGNAYAHRRQMQNTADAAALAGASLLCAGSSDATIWAKVQEYAGYNHVAANNLTAWYTDDAFNQLATVSGGTVPAGAAGIKVKATTTVAATFLPIVGLAAFQPQATAIAGTTCRPPALLVLSSNGKDALTMSGGAFLNMPDGSILVNSSNAQAFNISGGSSGITAKNISVTGNYTASGGSLNNLTPAPHTGTAPAADPLTSLPAPATTGLPVFPGQTVNGGTATLSPGVYTGPIAIKGGATVTFQPGIYILQAGLNCASSRIVGTEVLLYNQSGALVVSGGGLINLAPPSSGTYAGVTVFQARNNTAPATFSGAASSKLAGIYYFPTTQLLTLSGGSNIQLGSIIAATVNLSGGSFVEAPGTSPAAYKTLALVQ